MRELIPTVKITNHAGVKSIKDGMKSNSYSHTEREKKPSICSLLKNPYLHKEKFQTQQESTK